MFIFITHRENIEKNKIFIHCKFRYLEIVVSILHTLLETNYICLHYLVQQTYT